MKKSGTLKLLKNGHPVFGIDQICGFLVCFCYFYRRTNEFAKAALYYLPNVLAALVKIVLYICYLFTVAALGRGRMDTT